MKFTARDVVFEDASESKVFACSEHAAPGNATDPGNYVILSFSEDEDEQDRSLGLTGLHVEASNGLTGYGKVERVDWDGVTVSIVGCHGVESIHASIEVEDMRADIIQAAVKECNLANMRRSEVAE